MSGDDVTMGCVMALPYPLLNLRLKASALGFERQARDSIVDMCNPCSRLLTDLRLNPTIGAVRLEQAMVA